MKFISSIALLILVHGASAQDPLARTYAAHGGLENWRAQGTLLYDLSIVFGERRARDHQVFDLVSRHAIASNPDYAVGFDGTSFWQSTTDETGPIFPGRFYLWTPFYFLGVPFVFADPGVQKEELPPVMYDGEEHRVVRVTFETGVGDAPDDVYHLYIDSETHRVKLLRYTVSYFAAAQGQATDNLPESVILYDGWTETNAGLVMSGDMVAYAWQDDAPEGDPRATMKFANIRFLGERPDPARFAAPDGAEQLP